MVKVRKDLTGMTFGRLTVIKQVYDKIYPSGKKEPQWLCECSCGTKDIIVTGKSLLSGDTQSCGCYNKERTKETNKKYNTYDLSGEYGIGYTTNTNKPFYFDLDDYDLIKEYCWREWTDGYIVTRIDKKSSFGRENKYMSYITVNNKTIYLGYFDNKNEAIKARKQAEKEYFNFE